MVLWEGVSNQPEKGDSQVVLQLVTSAIAVPHVHPSVTVFNSMQLTCVKQVVAGHPDPVVLVIVAHPFVLDLLVIVLNVELVVLLELEDFLEEESNGTDDDEIEDGDEVGQGVKLVR